MTALDNRPGVLGVATTALLALLLTAFLLIATTSGGDVVPRPFVLLALYLAPAAIGWLGLRQGDPALLTAAGVILIPASFLSFTGVTLIFLIPAVLLLTGAQVARRRSPGRGGASASLRATVAAILPLAAGWAVLFGFTEPRCFDTATGSGCSSSATSITGIVVGASLLVVALALAAWPMGRRVVEPRE
jgi:hypothetical protein